ncbi:MAG TPA: CARDB domain-containing protein, partial [Candidatus Poseidoniales archaeon]|nr:CARDB domain-containing protein [Candidatus Poseidoniales archaeon]
MADVTYEGANVIFTVSIWNNGSEVENNVKLWVYKDSQNGEQIGDLDLLNLEVGETKRTYMWPIIAWGENAGQRTIYIAIESANGGKEQQDVGSIQLVAAPNLVAETIVLNASSTLLGGEELAFNVTYSNSGHAVANDVQGQIEILSKEGTPFAPRKTSSTFDIGDVPANTSSTTLEVAAVLLNLEAPSGGSYSARFTIIHQAGDGEAPQMIETDDDVTT